MTRSFLCLLAAAFLALSLTAARAAYDEDRTIVDSLAAMLRAGRSVISESQPLINDPKGGPKGLTGEAVLAGALAAYQKATGVDPRSLDATSRQGRLIGFEMKAITEVMDANQTTIDTPGVSARGRRKVPHRRARVLFGFLPLLPRRAQGRDGHHRLSQGGREARRPRRRDQHRIEPFLSRCQRPPLPAASGSIAFRSAAVWSWPRSRCSP